MDDWPFAEPPNVATVTTRQIIYGNEPIPLVSRDADDGCWQFLTGGSFEVADGMIILLRNMVKRDPSLTELADLPLGWQAWRQQQDSPWERGPAETSRD
jgi:hypothetical protein